MNTAMIEDIKKRGALNELKAELKNKGFWLHQLLSMSVYDSAKVAAKLHELETLHNAIADLSGDNQSPATLQEKLDFPDYFVAKAENGRVSSGSLDFLAELDDPEGSLAVSCSPTFLKRLVDAATTK